MTTELQTVTTTYTCTDEGDYPAEFQAESAEDAAQAFVDGADWPTESKTYWINVHVTTADTDGEDIRVAIEPTEPECTEDAHAYGDESVRGHGGGVVIVETCACCGMEKVTDTWAQCSATGVQGLNSTEYRAA